MRKKHNSPQPNWLYLKLFPRREIPSEELSELEFEKKAYSVKSIKPKVPPDFRIFGIFE